MSIQVKNISKYFGENLIFENVSFELFEGEKYALIGDNGTGKTTLLKILAEQASYQEGEVFLQKNMNIGFLKQDSGLIEANTIEEEIGKAFAPLKKAENKMKEILTELENIEPNSEKANKLSGEYTNLQNYFEVNDGYNFDSNINRVLTGMGFADKPRAALISSLSGGEKTRLGLAKILLEKPSFLILDEPTNHLDFETLGWLEDYLISYKGILLVVSHDRYFLDKITTRTLEIENKTLHEYKGGYSKYLLLKEERMERLWKEYHAQQEEIEKLEDYVRRNIVRASTTKMAQSRRKVLEKMEVQDRPDIKTKNINFKFSLASKPYKDLLDVKNLEIGFKYSDKNVTLMKDLNFEIKRGEKIGIIGDNGIGKSTLLKTLMGITKPLSGKITWGENAKIGYYEQETLDLEPAKKVIDDLWDRYPYLDEFTVRSRLASIGLLEQDIYKLVENISGGEKAKLKFAIISFKESNILVLDEPTNHLDLNSKEVLERALNDYEGTLIFISHDRYFLNKIPERIFEFTQAGLQIYSGNYQYYMERKERLANYKTKADDENQAEQNQSSSFRGKEDRRKEAFKRKRIGELEKIILKLESEISEVQEKMLEENIYSNYELMDEQNKILIQLKADLSVNMLEWEKIIEES